MSRLEELMALVGKATAAAFARGVCQGINDQQGVKQFRVEEDVALRALRDELEPQGWQLVPQRLLMRVHACLAADWRDQPHNKDLRALCDEVWQAAAPKEPT